MNHSHISTLPELLGVWGWNPDIHNGSSQCIKEPTKMVIIPREIYQNLAINQI
jgi:hypothetical protein